MSDDNELFRRLFADVRPLKSDKMLIDKPTHPSECSSIAYRRQRAGRHRPVDDIDIDSHPQKIMYAQSELSFRRSGIRLSDFKQLKTAKLGIQGRLDLHGCKVEQALRQLHSFIHHSCQQNRRCVLLIHGKGQHSQNGQAVLKTYVAHWLEQMSEVLAFHSAQLKDGGLGAVYVLLRKAKKDAVPSNRCGDRRQT